MSQNDDGSADSDRTDGAAGGTAGGAIPILMPLLAAGGARPAEKANGLAPEKEEGGARPLMSAFESPDGRIDGGVEAGMAVGRNTGDGPVV